MRVLSIILLASVVCIYACKMDGSFASNDIEKSEEMKDAYALLNQDSMPAFDIQTMRNNGVRILEKRIADAQRKFYTILEKDIWVCDAVVRGNGMNSNMGGRWIDFKEDLTYDYGINEKTIGTGGYFFDFDKLLLLMVDDNKAIKPQEFDVKLADDMMVVVGTPVYEDNNMQSKFTRITNKPAAIAPVKDTMQ
ncbi:MAG: hypothetical protein WAU01_13750 [Saprospiraceae bacterium]